MKNENQLISRHQWYHQNSCSLGLGSVLDLSSVEHGMEWNDAIRVRMVMERRRKVISGEGEGGMPLPIGSVETFVSTQSLQSIGDVELG